MSSVAKAARASGSSAVGLQGRNLMIALAIGPPLIFYGIFLVFPLAYSFFMSVHDWPGASMVKPPEFIGLDNYRYALFEDSLFYRSLLNTFYFLALNIPLGLIAALAIAVLINSLPRYRGVYRILFFLPVLTSEVAAAIIWRYVFQPRFGLINTALMQVGDSMGVALPLPTWLNDPMLAMPAIVAIGIWKGAGYIMVIILAGLQGIPETFYEAARIDGAGAWQTFRHITLPLLRPTLTFLLITGMIGSLQVFTPMYVLTKGGPVDATRTIVYHLYEQAFSSFRFGYASSLAVILFVLILALTIVQTRFIRVGWEY